MAQVLVLSATPRPFAEDHGGKQRLVNLIKSLSEKHSVTLLSLSWEGEEFTKNISKNIRHISVAVENNIIKAKKLNKTELTNPNNDILIAVYKKYFKNYIAKMNLIASNSNVVIVDHYATAPMIDYLKNEDIPVFYCSQNCETSLAMQLYKNNSYDVKLTHEIEKRILERSKAFAYCSTDDIKLMNNHFFIDTPSFYIPNGTELPEGINIAHSITSKDILFVGSGHPPNVVAGKAVMKLSEEMPDYNFIIAGTCANGLLGLKPGKNVKLIPKISNDEIDQLFSTAFAFINPMETGSGTHLKMMKALSYGLPIISSDVGARGFSEKEKKDCMILANATNEMIDSINKIQDEKLYKKMSKQCLELAKDYDWKKIGKNFVDAIDSVIEKKEVKMEEVNNKKQKILVYSIIRNEAQYMEKYHKRLALMVKSFPQYEFYLSIYENDSNDGTKQRLMSKDWSMFAGFSFISENIMTKDYGSTKDADRVKNLSIARNKAIEAGGFLEFCDYVMMIESDFDFGMDAVKKVLDFKNIEPEFDIVSAISIRRKYLYDHWATRKTPEYDPAVPRLDPDYKLKSYDKYYSTSNGICLYRAEPFREGVRYGWINTVTGEADCDTVVVCQNFHDKGYHNIYIIHDAEVYHEHH